MYGGERHVFTREEVLDNRDEWSHKAAETRKRHRRECHEWKLRMEEADELKDVESPHRVCNFNWRGHMKAPPGHNGHMRNVDKKSPEFKKWKSRRRRLGKKQVYDDLAHRAEGHEKDELIEVRRPVMKDGEQVMNLNGTPRVTRKIMLRSQHEAALKRYNAQTEKGQSIRDGLARGRAASAEKRRSRSRTGDSQRSASHERSNRVSRHGRNHYRSPRFSR